MENTTEKEMSAEQSLALIHSMINTSKNKIADDSFYFIFWGWLVLGAALINYLGIKMDLPYTYIVWPVLMPLGALVSVIYGRMQKKNEKVKTYIDTYLGYVWLAFFVALMITIFTLGVHGVKITYFFIMILYGMATLISGGLLNFKPLIIGSLGSFICAILSLYVDDVDQFLLISAALLFSYIIPGHLLKSKYASQNNV